MKIGPDNKWLHLEITDQENSIDIDNHFHYTINIKYTYGNRGFKEENIQHEKTISRTSSRSKS